MKFQNLFIRTKLSRVHASGSQELIPLMVTGGGEFPKIYVQYNTAYIWNFNHAKLHRKRS